jgi:tetratricopeptide (TPR) repeat protein
MKKNILTLIIAALSLSSCSNFLEEENRQSLTSNEIFQNPSSFDGLVGQIYYLARNATSLYNINHLGTDIYTRGAIVAGIDELNDYVNLRPFNGSVSSAWTTNYRLIAAANVAIDRSNEISGLTETAKSKGLGQAKFFRAFAYFNLVEQFGPVPLILNEVRSAQVDLKRVEEVEVYAQILKDLDEALAAVDETPALYGTVSKDAVRHLKAQVLLTRGYKSFKGANDFSEAASLAETVISRHPLASDFAQFFTKAGQRNNEVVFALLYGSNPVTRREGNDRHLLFKFSYDVYPGMTRSTLYHRGLGPAPTPYFFSLFEEGDKREAATLRRTLLAEIADAERGVKVGDTVIHFPKTPWSQVLIGSKSYTVVNPENYFIPNGTTQIQYPMFRKFDDPGVPYTNGGIDPEGERDAVIMRSGEAYLFAAEAYLQMGDKAKAATFINALRTRAGWNKPVTADQMTIDVILEESARELAGETSRWMELKRTGKLMERALKYNPHVALNNALRDFHLLRPIPNSEIDASGGSLTQNNGY